jgi:hypothetical protein
MSKRVFLFMNHFNKKIYKGSPEMYKHCDRGLMLGKDKVLCRTNSVKNKHSLYYKRTFLCMCIRGPAKSQMTFYLQTILVQDQTFHLYNHYSFKYDPTPRLLGIILDLVCTCKGRSVCSKGCVSDYNDEWNMYILWF